MLRVRSRGLIPIAALLAFASSASADEPPELGDGPDPDCMAEVHLALAGVTTASVSTTPTSEPSEPAAVAPTRPAPATAPAPAAAPAPAPPPAPAPVPAPAPETAPAAEAAPAPHPAPELPRGRAIAALSPARCFAILESAGVEVSRVPAGDAAGVRMPVRLRSPIGGVAIASRGGEPVHEIMDCRLAVALLAWAPALRRAGVRRAIHYSTYRPGARVRGTGRVSGHAHGLAIDLAEVELDGASVDVLDGWTARARGVAPCHGTFDEPAGSATLRQLVCHAVERDLFQVVLTPHFDAAHANHVHLELVPDVTWSYVH